MQRLESSIRSKVGDLRRSIDERIVPDRHWDASRTHEYLVSLVKGEENLLPCEQYPDVITLYKDWHTLFNLMERQTQEDGHERWAMIGYREGRSSILLPTTTVRGSRERITHEAQEAQRQQGYTRSGIVGELGNIHTHPDYFGKQEGIAFSFADLFYVTTGADDRALVLGLVESDKRMLAFASAETTPTRTPPFMTQEAFIKFWKKKYTYLPEFTAIFPQFEQSAPLFDFGLSHDQAVDMNDAIAGRHNLVYYVGRKDEPLIQTTPKAKAPRYGISR